MKNTTEPEPDELQDKLDSFSEDMKALVNISPKQFDVLRIANMVSQTPPRKWNAAQAVVNATLEKKRAEQVLKSIRATKMMAAKLDSTLKAAPDRIAWVDRQDEVQNAEAALIKADGDLIAARLAYECLDDLFTAGKKIMDYLVKQDEATKQYNRFVDEGRQAQ